MKKPVQRKNVTVNAPYPSTHCAGNLLRAAFGLLSIVTVLTLLSAPLLAQEKKSEDKKSGGSGGALLTELQPTIGIQPAVTIAMGDIGPRAGIGFGGFLYAELRMPLKPMVFHLLLGFNGGFIYHGKFMMAPIMLYARPLLQFNPNLVSLRPYLKIGGGISPVFGSSGSSMDPTFSGGLGLGIIPSKAPFIEVTVEASFMMLFETIRGDFMNINVGVAYRFVATEVKK